MALKNRFTLLLCVMAVQFPVYAVLTPSITKYVPEELTASTTTSKALALQNLQRSIAFVDLTIEKYFDAETFAMHRYYNPFTQERSKERASVWMYTAGIESVNAILHALKVARDLGYTQEYDLHYTRYVQLLEKLYQEADYYLGTFELSSYTQSKVWSVYAVDAVSEKGKANVSGILNVYDDQMWLLRELLDSYKITGNKTYLAKAEYLTAYVLDGWDSTRDAQGKEHGGIPWGPGYTTKHACSNGPMVSPLVWLYEIYKGQSASIEHRYISAKDKKTRLTKNVKKSYYYLSYAKALYAWQKKYLLNTEGVYTDMMGGCDPDCSIRYEEVDGVKYRANTLLKDAVGRPFSYNSGTMLSGAADLFRATKEKAYVYDAQHLAEKSFSYFAQLDKELPGYYSFDSDGFNNWFHGIMLRGYQDIRSMEAHVPTYLNAFQRNLDYAYSSFNKDGFLPSNLLVGWAAGAEGAVEGMFMFSYASQYAILATNLLAGSKD